MIHEEPVSLLNDQKRGVHRNAPECVAGCMRNQWLGSIGIGGLLHREPVAAQGGTCTKVNRKLL